MNEFIPNLKNVVNFYRESGMEINGEDKLRIERLQSNLNKCIIGMSLAWSSVLAWDIRGFFLKDQRLILKIFRTKYHVFNAVFMFLSYSAVNAMSGMKALDILGRYDPQVLTLKISSDDL